MIKYIYIYDVLFVFQKCEIVFQIFMSLPKRSLKKRRNPTGKKDNSRDEIM